MLKIISSNIQLILYVNIFNQFNSAHFYKLLLIYYNLSRIRNEDDQAIIRHPVTNNIQLEHHFFSQLYWNYKCNSTLSVRSAIWKMEFFDTPISTRVIDIP